MKRWIPGIALSLLAACGGGQTEATSAEAPPAAPAVSAEPTPEERLRIQQEASCAPMCERITDCSIEDARAQLSAEQFAELDVENTAPRHTEQCTDQCNASALSPRQVQVIRDCVSAESDCATYVGCLDAARKG